MNFAKITLATAALAFSSLAVQAADLSGAGATFPYPVYAKWADAYKKETGNGLNYQSIGSGGGIKQIKAKTVTFGASDEKASAAVARVIFAKFIGSSFVKSRSVPSLGAAGHCPITKM